MKRTGPLFLVGYMGCGKSTLGRKLAHRMGVAYVDTDHEVEQMEGAAVYDIFQYAGEGYFRRSERTVLERTIEEGAAVVSTGGGLPTWSDNMARMNEVGCTVYLRRSAENIASRLSPFGRQKRPRLRGLNDEELVRFMREDMKQREPHYAEAQLVIDCDRLTDDEILDLIMNCDC